MISIAIPTLDGAESLERTLRAVTEQGADEVVVLDSESTDGTRDVAARHGATVHVIPRGEFGHGRARNRLMELARGDQVAFLTQDAEPAGPDWLRRLAGACAAPGVGVACGPYTPREDVHPSERRALADWFASMRPGVYTAADAGDPPAPGPATFASSANLCLSRAAWQAVPFRDVPYAEDQRLVLDLFAAGWGKAYVPEAPVVHSHAYGPTEQLRRWFDEFRALHEVYGWTAPLSPRTIGGTVRAEVRRVGAGGAPAAPAWHLGRALTAAAATRAGRLPAGLRRRASLEGRA